MDTKNLNNFYQKFTIARNRTAAFSSGITKLNATRYIPNIKKLNLGKNHFAYAIVGVLLLAAFLMGRQFSPTSGSFLGTDDVRTEAPAPIATQALNQKFEFPLRDEDDKEVAKITYFVETANLQDAFIYQGKVATAVKGRSFLIFNLKITNPYTKTIQINAKDYLRIRLNNSSQQLAPEIHNDPVEIQANSTKYTRIGLPINDSDKNLIVLIGELQGDKQTIKLDLKR